MHARQPTPPGLDRLALIAVIALVSPPGCGSEEAAGPSPATEDTAPEAPVDTAEHIGPPEVTADPATVLGHAQECTRALGPPPSWDVAADTLPIPITANGEAIAVGSWTEHTECDEPSWLSGSCVPDQRVGRKTGSTWAGEPDEDVTWVVALRRLDEEAGGVGEAGFNDIAMIGHRDSTGATCFFQAFPDAATGRIPAPGEDPALTPEGQPASEDFWEIPGYAALQACHTCHTADPWLHTAFIDQVRDPLDASEPYVPAGDPGVGPYHVVGSAMLTLWPEPLEVVQPEGNACTECHAVGVTGPGRCWTFVSIAAGERMMPLTHWSAQDYEGLTWMPPELPATEDEWEALYEDAVDELKDCCLDPEQAHCNKSQVPEGERFDSLD